MNTVEIMSAKNYDDEDPQILYDPEVANVFRDNRNDDQIKP